MRQGWKYIKLENVVTKGSSNISLRKAKEMLGQYPLFGAKGHHFDVSFFDQENEYLAIIKDGAGVGRVSKHPPKSSVVATLQYILPNEGYDIDFIKYFLESIDFEAFISGSTIPHIYFKDYKHLSFPDISLPEQKQIVAILDEAFEAIDQAKANIEKNIQNAEELFQSKLNAIFSQKGEGWEEKKLVEICEMIKRGIAPKYIEDGLVVINQKCIRDHEINLSLARHHNNQLKSVNPERLIQKGDVLINSTGTGTLGRVAQVRDEYDHDCTVDTHVTIARPKKGLFYNDFFGFAFIKIEAEITKSGEGTSGQTELSRKKLENDFKLSYPISHSEQKKLVKVLDALRLGKNELIEKYESKSAFLEQLKKSILQKAFSGELTTNEDLVV